MDDVLVALRDQLDELATIVAPLDEADWQRPSACPGWSVADVVLHLAQTNEMATASARGTLLDAASGAAWAEAGAGVDETADAAVAAERGTSGAEVRDRWQRSADDLVAAFESADPTVRVRWVVGDMSPRSLATTRIAETWIHTGDIADGLGVEQPVTDRLRHIAFLVHRTVPYAFSRADREPPGDVAFELDPPGGGTPWVFGEPNRADVVVRGPALDLCLVAGQRRGAGDTDLTATGPRGGEVLQLLRTFA